LINAAVLGLTDPAYNGNTNIQFIPNMDGFPNGRRLEDDVTTIELQAVGGVVLAAIGLWYDDYTAGAANPVTPNLLSVLTYNAGITKNDTTFKPAFPYVQAPWSGTGPASGLAVNYTQPTILAPNVTTLGMTSPLFYMTTFPNPFTTSNTIKYRLENAAHITIRLIDSKGSVMKNLVDAQQSAGIYSVTWQPGVINTGVYYIEAKRDGAYRQVIKVVKTN
jgi:hypothetical protein